MSRVLPVARRARVWRNGGKLTVDLQNTPSLIHPAQEMPVRWIDMLDNMRRDDCENALVLKRPRELIP